MKLISPNFFRKYAHLKCSVPFKLLPRPLSVYFSESKIFIEPEEEAGRDQAVVTAKATNPEPDLISDKQNIMMVNSAPIRALTTQGFEVEAVVKKDDNNNTIVKAERKTKADVAKNDDNNYNTVITSPSLLQVWSSGEPASPPSPPSGRTAPQNSECRSTVAELEAVMPGFPGGRNVSY